MTVDRSTPEGVPSPRFARPRLRRAPIRERGSSRSRGASAAVDEALEGAGQPLDAGTRAEMESRFGHDFSRVRIHTDDAASRSAREVGATAYTVGTDVVFGEGTYDPTTSSGRRRLAHELAHTIQQGDRIAGSPAGLTVEPPGSAVEAEAARAGEAAAAGATPVVSARAALGLYRETPPEEDLLLLNPYEESEEEEEELEHAGAQARVGLLEALERNDALTFLSRLRGLTAPERMGLYYDRAFLEAVHRKLRGFSFWIVRLILMYGSVSNYPLHVRQLHLAVGVRDIQRIKDLLRAFWQLTDPIMVPGVAEMIDEEFRRHPEHAELLRLATEREERRRTRGPETYRQVHYERPEGGGPLQLTRHAGTTHYDLARTATELRVIVRIRLVRRSNPGQTIYPTQRRGGKDVDKQAEWRQGIERLWNNRFALSNGRARLRLVFVPVFTEERPHFTVQVDESPTFVRSNQTMWWIGANERTAAHEFGHMVGNPDEYALPARLSEVATFGLTPLEARRTTIEGIRGELRPSRVGGYDLPGLMGRGEGGAAARHVWSIQSWFNMNLRGPDEPAFALEVL